MKALFFSIFFLVTVLVYANSDESVEIIRCVPVEGINESVYYSITFEKGRDGDRVFYLNKNFNSSSVRNLKTKIVQPKITIYRNVLIATSDLGRSGYVHIYNSDNKSLLDINLYGDSRFNTHYYVEKYSCKIM